jgi:hypothetical protein
MEEIKRLKMMLEGKVPITPNVMALTATSNTSAPGEVVYSEKIVYRDGENK